MSDFEVTGMEEILKKIDSMGKAGQKAYNKGLKQGAEPILKAAQKTRAFKDRTGKLRGSLKISNVKTKKGEKYVWVGDVDKKAIYSWYVDRKTAFLRSAFEANKKATYETIKQALAEELKNG